jgi:hypothetical protein
MLWSLQFILLDFGLSWLTSLQFIQDHVAGFDHFIYTFDKVMAFKIINQLNEVFGKTEIF